MDATDILCEIGEAFYHAKLEVVMIGNAAAAIQGAPVTTMDIDFAIQENKDMEENMIRARLSLPPNKRTGFLRKRLKNGGNFI